MNQERLQLVITNPCNYNYYKGEKFAGQPADAPFMETPIIPIISSVLFQILMHHKNFITNDFET